MQEEITIEIYENAKGNCPYIEWEDKLSLENRAKVRARINRIRLGNFGDVKSIKGAKGIFEIRLHFGAGYRIYYAKKAIKIVLLLCGGKKDSQTKDIKKAKEYWEDYLCLDKKE